MATLGGLMVAIGYAIGGFEIASVFLVIALVMNFVAFFFSDKIAIRASGAKPLSEQEAPSLYQMVRELTTRAGLPMPRLYMIPSDQPNAFGWSLGIMYSRGIGSPARVVNSRTI